MATYGIDVPKVRKTIERIDKRIAEKSRWIYETEMRIHEEKLQLERYHKYRDGMKAAIAAVEDKSLDSE